MHDSTYFRLLRKLYELEDEALADAGKDLERMFMHLARLSEAAKRREKKREIAT